MTETGFIFSKYLLTGSKQACLMWWSCSNSLLGGGRWRLWQGWHCMRVTGGEHRIGSVGDSTPLEKPLPVPCILDCVACYIREWHVLCHRPPCITVFLNALSGVQCPCPLLACTWHRWMVLTTHGVGWQRVKILQGTNERDNVKCG